MAPDHTEWAGYTSNWDRERDTMTILYAAFVEDPIEVAIRSLDLIASSYPDFHIQRIGPRVKVSAGRAGAMLETVVGNTSEGCFSENGLGFRPVDHSQESIGLCWEALQAVVFEQPCRVWLTRELFATSDISPFAELRPGSLSTGEQGFVLEAVEYDALAG